MCGNARFCHHIHGLCPNLKFNIHASRSYQSGMQRLITIDFWNRNVIFELAGYWLVKLMHQTQCGVAVKRGWNNNAKTIDVSHLREAEVLSIHFSID
jgi:hypothetical protein